MTFVTPWWLLLLIAPVGLAVAYLLIQRTRQKTALRFTSVDLLASVAPRRPGWQRHVPALGMVAALGILTVTMAGPAWAKQVPVDRATVILTLDTSASMVSNDVAPTRLAAAQQEAQNFVAELPSGVQVGLVTFSSTAQTVVNPTTDRAQLESAIRAIQVGAGTATGSGIATALGDIKAVPASSTGKAVPATIVLMSDGSPTVGTGGFSAEDSVTQAVAAAKATGVTINTIAFGTAEGTVSIQGQTVPVPYDPAEMSRIATNSGGESFTAQSADELMSVYDQIGRDIGYQVKTVDLSKVFAGIALALALAACCAALWWTQRIV
jgi:Ca-activated chloride channel family protein